MHANSKSHAESRPLTTDMTDPSLKAAMYEQPKMFAGINKNTLSCVVLRVGTGLMNSIFYFYYVKVFLNHYHIQENWFHFAQALYMVWNSLNDPLFGYLQDTSNVRCCRVRRLAILNGAVWYALSFLLPWFAWTDYTSAPPWVVGLHLIASLCLFDTLFTFVLLAWCCLYTEAAVSHEERLRLTRYGLVADIFSHSGIFFCEYFSDNLQNFAAFQTVCIFVAVIAFCCIRYTGKHAKTRMELTQGIDKIMEVRNESNYSVVHLTLQILRQKNFICFVLMGLLQVMHSTCTTSFLRIFGDWLVFSTETFSSVFKSSFYASLPIITQMIAFLGLPVISQYGAYTIMMCAFGFKVLAGLFMFCIIGRFHYFLLMIYILLDSFCAGIAWSLFPLLASDVIDADVVLHTRTQPLSGIVYGANALITKPGHSIAPMFVVAVLNLYNYDHIKNESVTNLDSAKFKDAESISELKDVMFALLCFVPVVLGVLQMIVFKPYSLKDTHKSHATTISMNQCVETC